MAGKKAALSEGDRTPNKTPAGGKRCFLCQAPCHLECSRCRLVHYCSKEHLRLHQHPDDEGRCLPYEAAHRPGVGRILRATRPIKAMELVLVDPGAVVGPNYTSAPVCLECLRPVSLSGFVCPGCRFPMCSPGCAQKGGRHTGRECRVLGRRKEWPVALKFKGDREESNAYSVVTPLRLLLLEEDGGDQWERANQLMDHMEKRKENAEEWEWYQTYICDFFREELGMDHFSSEQIQRAIGILNVNSVALHFGKASFSSDSRQQPAEQHPVGKGLYPLFAIMSHMCVCNARYTINPRNLEMHVRARRRIAAGEEISVQYLSALHGNLKRRRKIREEWYFDCSCHRCSDPTECGSNISAVKCLECRDGDVLPAGNGASSEWVCAGCGSGVPADVVEATVDPIEEALEDIGRSGEFHKYEDFIAKYADTVLHRNHFLIMTATRNLIQYLTYGASNSESTLPEVLRKKYDLCRHFSSVLGKVDPGFSEIRNFVQKELNFSRLLLCQHDLESGRISREDYLRTARQSLNALDEIERNKKITQFS